MSTGPIKILIVDDDEDVLMALERLLEGEGYTTVTAWSGREALALSETGHFDLLLIDEYLGDVESNTLFEELRQRHPNAFRVWMYTHRERREQPVRAGHAAVCKWEHAEVKASIRSCLAA